MAEIPPKQPVNGSETIRMGQTEGLPRIDESANTADTPPYSEAARYGAVARRQPGGEDQAFAILKAFQDYMENERQRAQRRTTTVILSFAALFAVIVAGFAVIWLSTMSGMQETQADLIKTAMATREAPPAQQIDVAAAIATAVEKANAGQSAAIAAAVAQAEKAAADREAAAKAGEAERAATAKAIEERLADERKKDAEAAYAKEAALAKSIADLSAMIEGVRKDNEQLRKDNEALRAEKAAAKPALPKKPVPKAPVPQPAQPSNTAKSTSPAGNNDAGSATGNPADTAPQTTTPADDFPLRAKIEMVVPKITVKRPAPPKGFSAKTVPLPVGEKGDGQINWHLLIPTEATAK